MKLDITNAEEKNSTDSLDYQRLIDKVKKSILTGRPSNVKLIIIYIFNELSGGRKREMEENNDCSGHINDIPKTF